MADRPFSEDDFPEISSVLGWAFALEPAVIDLWLKRAGHENVRLRKESGKITACLIVIPMGQFFGGRSVPSMGIAGVATPPERRGMGDATALLGRTLLEMRESGVALSSLYPASVELYRRSGYELAGSRFEVRAPIAALAFRDRSLPLRPMTADDTAAVEALYQTHAARLDGHLDRGPYVWARVRTPRAATSPARGFVAGEAGRIEGYAYLYELKHSNLHYDVAASDLVATTPAAARRLLTLAADHGTVGESFAWNAAPNDGTTRLLSRAAMNVRVTDPWMLRIVDLPGAIAARGWPEHARVELELAVTDDVVPANAGTWVVRVEGGRGEAKRGGSGAIKIDVRALAALYAGFVDAHGLARSGEIHAAEGDLAKAATAFVPRGPWMPDMF